MKTLIIPVLAFLFLAAASPCFALREILPLTKEQAKGMGLEVRVKPAGLEAAWLELEFKPEGKLKGFTHVELHMTGEDKALLLSAVLRETRSSSGSVVVAFTVSRAYLDKTTLSVVMRDPREAGDHTYELRLKGFVDLEKLR